MTWLVSRRDEVVEKLSQHLMEVQPRDDYREFAQLTLNLLGEESDAKFCTPGISLRKMDGKRHLLPENLRIPPSISFEKSGDRELAAYLFVRLHNIRDLLVRCANGKCRTNQRSPCATDC